MTSKFDRPPWTSDASKLDPAWLEFPALEIYPYGWHANDELELVELGDRVSDWLSWSMMGAAFSDERSRVNSAKLQMLAMIVRRTGPMPLDELKAAFPDWIPHDLGKPEN